MQLARWRVPLLIFGSLAITIFIVLGYWLFQLDQMIGERLSKGRFLPPVEFYSRPLRVATGQIMAPAQVIESLKRQRYVELSSAGQLNPGNFIRLSPLDCQANLGTDLPEEVILCLLIRKFSTPASSEERGLALLAFSKNDSLAGVYGGEPLQAQPFVELDPVLFAQFVGPDPILRDLIELGQTPTECLNSAIAIEDSDFLHHAGVSATGILRAIFKNITTRRFAQGGSTITQQLVKNYFLSPKKTLSRKIKEMAMAILLEGRATKDEILETYLNEIYMGQNGTFQIRGYGSAADYYFGKQVSDLRLSECALLAAVINNPGMYNPFTKPEASLKRRGLVLQRMEELGLITSQDRSVADLQPLPKNPKKILSEPAPYFVDAVRKELQKMALDTDLGLKIYTTLDLLSQETAQTELRVGLDRLEADFKTIKKIKEEQKKSLEGAVVTVDPSNGEVTAIVGGRNFKQSQFNRVFQSRRQVGSVFKPIVYLTALERGVQGERFSPLSILSDEKFVAKYEGQSWTPTNYDKKLYGSIPAFFALKNSLNVATSWLALKVGLENVVEVAREIGITSDLKPVPALALGAFELTPIEVAQVYTTLARLGEKIPLTYIRRVESLEGDVLHLSEPEKMRVANEQDTANLVGMMKQTLLTGTAQLARLQGFTHPAAGKTGTTNETRDAWFAGFTPHHVAIVWVGYDDNTQHGLTGASGAVPIWTAYMKKVATLYPPDDFAWPVGVQKREIPVDLQIDLNIPEDKATPLAPMELIFSDEAE